MHSGAQVSGVSFRNTGYQVGGPSESQRGRKASDDRGDLPFEPEWIQGFINRSHVEPPSRDEDVIGRSIASGSDPALAQCVPVSHDADETVSEQALRPHLRTRHLAHNASFQIDAPVTKWRTVSVRLLHEAQPHAGRLPADAGNEVRSKVLHKTFAGPQRECSNELFEVEPLGGTQDRFSV